MAGWRDGLKKEGKVYTYRIRVNGREHNGSTRCRDRESAVRWLKAFRDSLSLRAVGITGDPVYTLGETLAEWEIAHTETRSASHVDGVVGAIRRHAGPALVKPLRDLKTAAVERILTEYQGTDGGRAYLLRALKLVCGWAIHREWLDAIPFRVRGPRVQEKPRVILAPAQVGDFLRALDSQVGGKRGGISRDVGGMVRLILALGLREAEVRTARWEWLDVHRWMFTPGETKGGEAVALPVPEWIRGEILELRGDSRSGLMFPGRGGETRKRAYLLPFVQAAGEAIGIHGLTPHRLRASWATAAHEAGAPLETIQRALRHESVTTTMAYVSGHGWEGLESALDSVGAVMMQGVLQTSKGERKNGRKKKTEQRNSQ